ncbi:sensor histidine kinase [Nocardioides sp. Y6]|uniref:Sensor histidine kinase n=1 Tax=Nocardioides malaquae TaxID=2773426 RepID=A0ABR9RVR9_9ACTN|nr:sensor histidine kinase [Nocardioides malaquae]MBE7325445.1 sensor histidine kinase [Nocardioides malaquae]
MRCGYPQPSAAQLRLGLHGLVGALAVVVGLRALTGDGEPVATLLLVVLFLVAYAARARAASGAVRLTLMVVLVALWAGLVFAGADAAYVSLALFLVFLTELAFVPAMLAIGAVTAVDVGVRVAGGGSSEQLLAPLLGAAVSVLVGLGFRVLFDATTAQRDLIEQLQVTRAELVESERAAGQAEERERVAREIHDTVAQGLSSIQLLLHAAEAEVATRPEQALERVILARDTAASSLVEARRIVAELSPADLVDSSLAVALARVCERAPAQITFAVDGTPAEVPMPVEAALVRIAQSAVANVVQHAGGGAHAVVTLSWSGDRVRLDVVDDGPGLDVSILESPAVATFGLDTIQTRVTDLGGEFAVESEPGHTALAVSFALGDGGST